MNDGMAEGRNGNKKAYRLNSAAKIAVAWQRNMRSKIA